MMKLRRSWGIGVIGCALFALGAGCGGKVVLDAGSAGGAGGAGSTGPGPGPGPSTTSASSSGVGGGACGVTSDGFFLELQYFDGSVWGCSASQPTATGQVSFNAEVVEVFDGGLVLDSCAPNADCAPKKSVLTVSAPDLSLSLPKGVFVSVRVAVSQPWGCEHRLVIENLPVWGGMPNAFYKDDRVFLAAADGTTSVLEGAPFVIEPIPLGCYPNEDPGCGIHEDYELRFFQPGAEAGAVTVHMGAQALIDVEIPGGQQTLVVRNLRSFETGWCDDYWNWSYWAANAAPLD